jgi:endonuclease-3
VDVKKVNQIIEILKQAYPDPYCELTFTAPHELLIAARLSAQCTDKRVNQATPALFAKFPTVEAFADADAAEIERMVNSCGLFRTKAADIKGMCRMLLDKFNGVIPQDLDSLLKLPGVGRKTANLIIGELYGKPAIVADTHVIRLSNRLGLASGDNPLKTEKALKILIPEHESMAFCHRLVLHGRSTCKARKPNCNDCALNKLCEARVEESK